MIRYQFARFIFIGVINTIFGFSIYALFIFLGFDYVMAALLGTILGVIFNFQTISRFVFKKNDYKLFFRFIFVYVVTYFLSISIIGFLKEFGLNDYISGFIALFPCAIVSFFMNKYFVYGDKNENN